MAKHKLTKHFVAFFKRINPSPTYNKIAARAHSQITALIEDKEGPAGDLGIKCFLQGSYRRDTAIHTINDVDVVALCRLSYTPAASQRTRDQIFEMIAAAIATNKTYRDKVTYRKRSVCVKVLLEGIKIEVLPALRVKGKPFENEPFYMFRPNEDESLDGFWRPSFARHHQYLCTKKNVDVNGLFVPMIKVLKHVRSIDSYLSENDAVSFHIECLLYALKKSIYTGATCECIENVLKALAGFTPEKAKGSGVRSPCRDKILFDPDEWSISSYERFNEAVKKWYQIAADANEQEDRDKAIDGWKKLLGEDYFPRNPQ